MPEVTAVLEASERGEPHAAEQLLPLIYDELRLLAARASKTMRLMLLPLLVIMERCGRRWVHPIIGRGWRRQWLTPTTHQAATDR